MMRTRLSEGRRMPRDSMTPLEKEKGDSAVRAWSSLTYTATPPLLRPDLAFFRVLSPRRIVYPSMQSSASRCDLLSHVSVRAIAVAEVLSSSSLMYGTFDGTVCGIRPLMFR